MRSKADHNEAESKRAKKGRPPGRTKPPPDDSPPAEKLTWALETIGTKRLSIAPDVLEDYDAILDAPRVRASASPEATKPELAKKARDVLATIFSELRNETDRLVGEAILAANQFAGMQVQQRKALLNGLKDGCGPDGYKRRRERVLEEIVGLLLVSDNARTDHIDVVSDAERALVQVATSAAAFYYAGMGVLFSFGLEEACGLSPWFLELGRSPTWNRWSAPTFDRFARFSESVTALQKVLTDDLNPKRRIAAEHLIAHIQSLHEGTVSYGPYPLGSPELKIIEEFSTRHYPEPDEVRHIDELKLAWSQWYGHQLFPTYRRGRPKDKPLKYRAFTFMLHKVVIIVRNIGQFVTYGEITPLEAERTRAHRELSYFHDTDSHSRVFNDQPLRLLADGVFDQLDTKLAQGPIVWDYITIEELFPGGHIVRNPIAGY